MNSLTIYKTEIEEPLSVRKRIDNKVANFILQHGYKPTKVFISIDLIEELLIEMLGLAPVRKVTKDPKKKNTINDMEVYHVIEKDVVEVL